MDKTQMEKLREPFPESQVKWKAQSTTKDKQRALAVAYVDARNIMQRLDDVIGAENWGDDFKVLRLDPAEVVAQCWLTVGDVTKSDVGEAHKGDSGSGDLVKTAFTDAFKRAAVKFGICRYLYFLPGAWVDYDEQYKKLKEMPKLPTWATPAGWASIQKRQDTETPEAPEVLSGADEIALKQKAIELAMDLIDKGYTADQIKAYMKGGALPEKPVDKDASEQTRAEPVVQPTAEDPPKTNPPPAQPTAGTQTRAQPASPNGGNGDVWFKRADNLVNATYGTIASLIMGAFPGKFDDNVHVIRAWRKDTDQSGDWEMKNRLSKPEPVDMYNWASTREKSTGAAERQTAAVTAQTEDEIPF